MSYSFSLILPSSLTNHWKRTSSLEVCKIIFQKWASRTNMFFPWLGKCLWLTRMIKEGNGYKIWHHRHICPCFLSLSPFKLLALSQNMHLSLSAQTLGLAFACLWYFPALACSGNLIHPSGKVQILTLLWNLPHFFPKHDAPLFSIALWTYLYHQIDHTYF